MGVEEQPQNTVARNLVVCRPDVFTVDRVRFRGLTLLRRSIGLASARAPPEWISFVNASEEGPCDQQRPATLSIRSSPTRGHFRYESGHHGDLWLDLELFCRQPTSIEPLVASMSTICRRHRPDAVCGPMAEGAFVALLVASKLDVEFLYAERIDSPKIADLFPVEYRIPAAFATRSAASVSRSSTMSSTPAPPSEARPPT